MVKILGRCRCQRRNRTRDRPIVLWYVEYCDSNYRIDNELQKHTEQGSRVVAHYNTNVDSLNSAFSRANPSHFTKARADLASEKDVENMFNEFDDPIQVLVVNHGIWPQQDHPISQMTLDQWNKTISTNLTSSFLLVREFLRRLEGPDIPAETLDKVAVIFIGSTAGKYGEASHADYAASKSGE